MSGFGGSGFGSGGGFGAPNANNNNNNNNNNNPFGGGGGGSGFGNPSTGGFGSSSGNNAGTPFGGGGGFGGSTGASGPAFGSSVSSSPFGGGGTSNRGVGGGMTFGSSPNVMVTSSTNSSGGFGNNRGGGGFGGGSNNSNNSNSGFGGGGFGSQQSQQSQQQNSSSNFGNPFGGSSSQFQQQQQQQQQQSSAPFGGSQPSPSQQLSTPASTSFGGSQSQQAPMTFGSSSNVVVNNNNNNNTTSAPKNAGSTWGGGSGSNGGGSGFSGFDSSNNSNNNNNRSNAAGHTGFGSTWDRASSSRSGFPGNGNGNGNGVGAANPFGAGSSAPAAAGPPFGGGSGTLSGVFGSSAVPKTSTAAVNGRDDNGMGDDGEANANANANFDASSNSNSSSSRNRSIAAAQAQMEEKKRILKAKIEEKKRRLAERQQQKKRQEEAERGSGFPKPTGSASNESKHHHQQQQQQQPSQDPHQSLAERNAQRFAKQLNQVSARGQSPVNTSSSAATTTTTTSAEREHLEHAVNLVGLCETMCPDDELRRRETESDIQALEIPLPGVLHPPHWTLRDTAIKRFRRSAADYKLDVPEWVRPPEVLEKTLGYLEEWIMERDRQGPDQRFPQPNAPPPPLDVYQFIWDRTRMIRKDFILQNYVGTGGRCDAKAVRCHERIARWHAMCEHQLSHIEDFVNMQSQQNMQELGQTMKTLNSFYDDSMNRSTKEIPDEKTGRETFVPDTNRAANADASGDAHRSARGGCSFDTVQGRNPVDYNGAPLNNATDNPMIARRLIGDNNNKTRYRGTAEPEMRGLYMLMILENEGGMEVLKYAAKLFKERPAVYHSPPVQLALSIFKAFKDMNYARFFSILESPSTPYLFSCIMFKHVEIMRRIALHIMSRSYGGQLKTGEAIQDQYPLKRLVRLLCFEDADEAKKTCAFYNITVKEYTSQSTGEIADVIFWKASRFRVPKDPEKGHTLRLRPRKMMRSIERKLGGSTRLGVCRGEVSGDGAALAAPSAEESLLNPSAASFVPGSAAAPSIPAANDPSAEAKLRELMKQQELERAKLLKEAEEREEKERQAKERLRLLEEQKQLEEQRKRELEERQRAELEKRRREEQLREDEARRKQLEEEERLRRQREEEHARKIAAEKARKEAEEAAKKAKELEEQRRREEEERRRLEMERRLAEEKRRKELAEQERRRKEEEARRREALRLELEAKRKREAEERRKANEWKRKIDAATKVVLWHRWKCALSRHLERSVGSRKSLGAIDPFYHTDSFRLADVTRMAASFHNESKREGPVDVQPTSKRILEEAVRKRRSEQTSKLSIADMVLGEVGSMTRNVAAPFGSRKSTLLLKIALICPETTDVRDQSYAGLLHHWIGSHVDIRQVEQSKSNGDSRCFANPEVRVVVVRGSNYEVCSTCDVALFVVPPQWTEQKASMLGHFASSVLDEDIPRVALVFSDLVDGDRIRDMNQVIATELGGNMDAIPIIHPSELSIPAFESALELSFCRIAKLFVREAAVGMTRIPAMHLATKAILTVLWQCIPSDAGEVVDEDIIIECSRLSVATLVEELGKQAGLNEVEWSLWPAPEFCSRDSVVESYFADGEGLPLEWRRCLDREFLAETYKPLLEALRGHFRDAYQRILVDAPITVQNDCASECAQCQYRRCLEKALLWMQKASASSGCYLYLPEGMLELVMEKVTERIGANPLLSRRSNGKSRASSLGAAAGNAEEDNYDAYPKRIEPKKPSGGDDAANGGDVTTDVAASAAAIAVSKRTRSTGENDLFAKRQRRDNPHNATEGASSSSATDSERKSKVPPPASASPKPNGRSGDGQRKNGNKTRARTTTTTTRSNGDAYQKKLERLLKGDEIIDLMVGDASLSLLLRNAPKPTV